MKKVSLLIIILSVFRLGIGSDDSFSVNMDLNEDKRIINELQIRLGLSDVQILEIERIFSAAESQKKIDVDLYRSSSAALIRAAERRREIVDSRITDLLTDVQKNNYDTYLTERKLNDEIFQLKNGLLLTDKQIIKIELIISEYRDRLERLFKKLDYYIHSGQDKKNKASESSRLMRSKSSGLEGRTPELRKLEMGPPGKIRDIRSEKAKEIQKYLNEDQKILYKEYLKFEDQLLNIYIKKLRK